MTLSAHSSPREDDDPVLSRLKRELKAISLACLAHAGQVDKGGMPYVLHPLRVMDQFAEETDRTVAVLHDVLEDGPEWRVGRLLREAFSEEVVRAVETLTRGPVETYDDFIFRILGNPLAVRVKIADIRDNMDLSRIPSPTAKDHLRVEKYRRALVVLEDSQEPLSSLG